MIIIIFSLIFIFYSIYTYFNYKITGKFPGEIMLYLNVLKIKPKLRNIMWIILIISIGFTLIIEIVNRFKLNLIVSIIIGFLFLMIYNLGIIVILNLIRRHHD